MWEESRGRREEKEIQGAAGLESSQGYAMSVWSITPPKLLSQKPGSYSTPAQVTHPLSDISTMMVACMGQGEMLKSLPRSCNLLQPED